MTAAPNMTLPHPETPRLGTVGQRLAYGLYRCGFAIIGWMPERLAYGIAGMLGSSVVRLSKKRRAHAMTMLHLAYPDEKDDAVLLKLARQGSANLFKVSIDMVLATRRLTKGSFEKCVDMSELRDSGLPAPWIGVSGHLGGWEGGSIGVSFTGYDAHVTARVINNPLLTRWLLETRQKAGLQIHDRRGGIRDVAAALEKGGVLVQAIDQHQRKRGIQAPWFGRMASCERAAATLAVRRGYPLMVAASIRIGKGFRFKWVIQEIIQPENTGDHAADIQHTVERVNLSLEALIRRYPEQYLWIHNRYRTAQPA